MSERGAATSKEIRETMEAMSEASRYWWILLVTGAAWLLFAIIIFRFDWSSVSAISILFGCALLAFGATEFFMIPGASGGWKIAHGLLGVLFIVIGVIAFIHPGNTFAALAAVLSFYFIVKGMFDIVVAFMRHGEDLWWLQLLIGLAELLLGFWAAGNFGNKTILLIVWVGAAALIRGISQIVTAFAVRSFREPDRAVTAATRPG
jgi:uncharacterized membrane protein HdeD (DUF308 family)